MTPQTKSQKRKPRPVRCKPTLHATFRGEQLVRVQRRHVARVEAGEHVGCYGPCVGTVDELDPTEWAGDHGR